MKRLMSYSICIAVIITALAYAFYDRGGELLAYPGLMIEVLLTGFILLAIPTDDYYYKFPPVAYLIFNTVFYTLAIFAILLLVTHVSNREKNDKD